MTALPCMPEVLSSPVFFVLHVGEDNALPHAYSVLDTESSQVPHSFLHFDISQFKKYTSQISKKAANQHCSHHREGLIFFISLFSAIYSHMPALHVLNFYLLPAHQECEIGSDHQLQRRQNNLWFQEKWISHIWWGCYSETIRIWG